MVTVTFSQKHIGILAQATTAEYLGLIFWLALVTRPDAGILAVVGVALLFLGFFLERVAVVRGLEVGTPIHLIALSAALETVFWIVWLALADRVGHLAAGVVFVLLIIVEHSIQMKAGSSRPLRSFLTHPAVLFFSLTEALGGVIWLLMFQSELAILSGFVMFAALLLEHIVQGVMGLAVSDQIASLKQ